MLWLTRMSIFDTFDDMEADLLATQRADAWALFTTMVYDSGQVAETHPVYRGWLGYHAALAAYGAAADVALAARHIGRGGLAGHFAGAVEQLRQSGPDPVVMPPWFEDTDVLRSHRSNIIRRWPEYADVWPGTPERMPYLFPFVDDEGGYTLNVSKAERALLQERDRVLPKSIQKKVANL